MLKSPKLYCLLSLLILVVFSVLGSYDMLDLKSTLLVEGFEAKTATDSQGNTYYAAKGEQGNIVYGKTSNTNNSEIVEENYEETDPNNPNNYNARYGSVTGPGGNTYYAAQGKYGDVVYGKVDSEGDVTVNHANESDYGIYYPENGIIVVDETIPPNSNNLIKKSQIVPPVCPACPYPPPPAYKLDSNGQPEELVEGSENKT